jgi:hypothetical protein
MLARREEFTVPQTVALKCIFSTLHRHLAALAGAALDRVLLGGLVVTTYQASL